MLLAATSIRPGVPARCSIQLEKREAAGTPLHRHYYRAVNYHLIGTYSWLIGPVSFMCCIQVYNNRFLLTLFLQSLTGSGLRGTARTKQFGWVKRGRHTGQQMCGHEKADLVIVEPKRGLICNEARASTRGRFLSEAAPSFFSLSVTKR